MKSVLLADYKRLGKLPSIDALLDWRTQLDKLKKEGNYPKEWYDNEIKATDELLEKHSI